MAYVLLVIESEAAPAVGATAHIRDRLRKEDGRWLVEHHQIDVDPSIRVAPAPSAGQPG